MKNNKDLPSMNDARNAKVDSPSFGERLHKAGEMALASFSGPAAGVIGCAAMYGSALLVSKWTGNDSGQSLQGLQGLLALGGGAALALGAVGSACMGAIKGFVGQGIDNAVSLGSSLKSAGLIAASGIGAAAITGGAIMGVNGMANVLQGASSPWVAAGAVAGMIVSGYVAISGSFMAPMGMAFAGLNASSAAVDGTDIKGVPLGNIAEKVRQRKERQAEAAMGSVSPSVPRLA